MDFAKAKNHWPTFKNNEQATALKEHLAVNYLESYLRNSRINSKVPLHDSIIVLFKNISKVFTEKMFSI